MPIYNVHSIFESISGEAGPVIRQGAWTTFVRLQGCNLNCAYCDTQEARKDIGAYQMTPEEIASYVKTSNVLITGGEPLLQDVEPLVYHLLISGRTVQIETNGSVPISGELALHLSDQFGIVADVKCPSSKMETNIFHPKDLVGLVYQSIDFKFVIGSMADTEFAKKYISMMPWQGVLGRFIFSPMNAEGGLIGMISRHLKNSKPEILDNSVFSLQLHKIAEMP